MENHINIIYEDHEEIELRCYFQQEKDSLERKHARIENILNDIGITNYSYCSLEDAIKNQNKNYYYIVHQIQNMYFLSNSFPFSYVFLDALKNNQNIKIIFLNEREIEEFHLFEILNERLKIERINPKQIYLINNNGLMDTYKNVLNFDINVYPIRYLPYHMTTYLMKQEVEKNIMDKKFLFMCHNRRMKPHRYGILSMLKKYDILNETDWSIIEGENYRYWHLTGDSVNIDVHREIFTDVDISFLEDEIKYFSQFDVKQSYYESELTKEKIDWITLEPMSYLNSYINITTESNFQSNDIHITEKAFKPFYFYQIPIFLSTYNHLKLFRERYDFDLFDDLIDHSYDEEPNHRTRFFMVFDEIKKLHQNRDFVTNFYKNNQERLINNHKKVINILNDKTDYNFFQSLINGEIS
jgi:hypothetical protein